VEAQEHAGVRAAHLEVGEHGGHRHVEQPGAVAERARHRRLLRPEGRSPEREGGRGRQDPPASDGGESPHGRSCSRSSTCRSRREIEMTQASTRTMAIAYAMKTCQYGRRLGAPWAPAAWAE